MSLRYSGDHALSPNPRSYLRHRPLELPELSAPHRARDGRGSRQAQAADWDDPLLEILFKRGLEHEKAYVESLRCRRPAQSSISRTEGARRGVGADARRDAPGADVIVQGALRDGRWYGRPDVLRRVETPSGLGAWSYEVADTKLARETRAGTILQLGLYSEMLAVAQGRRPEHFHIVTPDPDDADPRLSRRRLRRLLPAGPRADAGDGGSGRRRCRGRELSRAGRSLRRLPVVQRVQQEAAPRRSPVARRRHLAPPAARARVERRADARGAGEAAAAAGVQAEARRGRDYVRVREQARVQFESRGKTPPLYELRPFEDGEGLSRLPEPSPGDVFLDLEGDLFAAEGGREYCSGS